MPSKQELAKVKALLDTVNENRDIVSSKAAELSAALGEYHLASLRLKKGIEDSTSISAGARQDIVDNMGIYTSYIFEKARTVGKDKLARWAMLVSDKLADEVIAFEDSPAPATVERIRSRKLARKRLAMIRKHNETLDRYNKYGSY